MSEGSYLSIVSDIRGAGFPTDKKIGGFDEFMEEFANALDKSHNGGDEQNNDIENIDMDNGIISLEKDDISDNGIVNLNNINKSDNSDSGEPGIISIDEVNTGEESKDSGIVLVVQEDNIDPNVDVDANISISGSDEEKVLNEINNLASKLLH